MMKSIFTYQICVGVSPGAKGDRSSDVQVQDNTSINLEAFIQFPDQISVGTKQKGKTPSPQRDHTATEKSKYKIVIFFLKIIFNYSWIQSVFFLECPLFFNYFIHISRKVWQLF